MKSREDAHRRVEHHQAAGKKGLTSRGHPVFISYARGTSLHHAARLHEMLGQDSSFLDSSGIQYGEEFPARLADALLDARVIVVFADAQYFRSAYCLRELRLAASPFMALTSKAAAAQRRKALEHIIIALPPEGTASEFLPWLPPPLQTAHCPKADQTSVIAEQVKTRLRSTSRTLASRLKAAGGAPAVARAQFISASELPPTVSLAGFRPLYPVPFPPSIEEAFKGRAQDLWRIHFGLRTPASVGAAMTGALESGGGFGKTRLALEYAHRLGPLHYPGGLFWVDADVAPDRLREQFHGILRTLEPTVPESDTFRKQGRDAARELASALHKAAARGPILYIVDNIPEWPAREQPHSLETWCPALGAVSLLMTSRARLSLGKGILALPIDVLSVEAAVELLVDGVTGASSSDPEWVSIAEWVGHLPLALELLNRALRAGSITRDRLLEVQGKGPVQILDEQADHIRHLVPGATRDAPQGVTEALSISYVCLSAPARKAARFLAHLAPASIPVKLLDALGEELFPMGVRAELRSRHFVTGEREGAVPLFGEMHRVLADFLRRLSIEPASDLFLLGEQLLEVMTPEACLDPASWPLMNACLPHAEKAFQDLQGAAEPKVDLEIDLGMRIGRLYSAQGLSAGARKIEEAVVERARERLGHEHSNTLSAMHNLASTMATQGEYRQALHLEAQVLQARQRVLGPEHPATLATMINQAGTIADSGDLPRARQHAQHALQTCQRVLGPEHPDTLSAMNTLVKTLLDLGEYSQARQLQEQVLRARQRVLGLEHPDTLNALGNLARTLVGAGDYQQALQFEEQVLQARQRIPGPKHIHTLYAMGNLASTLLLMGEYRKALLLEEQVLRARQQLQGPEHPETLLAMGNLARTLAESGELAQAQQLEEQALQTFIRVLGPEHPDTLAAMGNLASTFNAMGEHPQALRLGRQVLRVRQRILGPEHPDTLSAMGNLASTFNAMGEYPQALRLCKRVLRARQRVLGPEHPDTLTAMGNLATAFSALGKHSEALPLEEQVLQARRRLLGPEHPHSLIAMSNMAWTLLDLGKHGQALQLGEQALEACRRVLGLDHPSTQSVIELLDEVRTSQEPADLKASWGDRVRRFFKETIDKP